MQCSCDVLPNVPQIYSGALILRTTISVGFVLCQIYRNWAWLPSQSGCADIRIRSPSDQTSDIERL